MCVRYCFLNTHARVLDGGGGGGGGGGGDGGDGGGGEPAKRQRGQKSKKKSHTARRIAKNAAKRATARIWDAQGMPDL